VARRQSTKGRNWALCDKEPGGNQRRGEGSSDNPRSQRGINPNRKITGSDLGREERSQIAKVNSYTTAAGKEQENLQKLMGWALTLVAWNPRKGEKTDRQKIRKIHISSKNLNGGL